MKKEMKNEKNNIVEINTTKKRNHDTWLEAVKKDGMQLRFVEEQTEDICLAAIKQNYKSVEYVDIDNDELEQEIYNKAVRIDPRVLKYVYISDYNTILHALGEEPKLFKHVEQSYKLCRLAFEQNPYIFKYCEYQTLDMCIKAVKKDTKMIKCIKDPQMLSYVYNYLKQKCVKIKDIALIGDEDEMSPVLFQDGSVAFYDEEDMSLSNKMNNMFSVPEVNKIFTDAINDKLGTIKDYKISHICTPSVDFLAITEDNLLVSNYCKGSFKLPDTRIIKTIDVMFSAKNKQGIYDNTTLFVLYEDKTLYKYNIDTYNEINVTLVEKIENVNDIIMNEYGFIIETDYDARIYSLHLVHINTLDKKENEIVRFNDYNTLFLISDNTISSKMIIIDKYENILKTEHPIEDVIVCGTRIYVLLNENGIYKSYMCEVNDIGKFESTLNLLVVHDTKPRYINAIENYELSYIEDGVLYIGGKIINTL